MTGESWRLDLATQIPWVVDLAEIVSLAAFVDAALLRRARLELLPGAHSGVEVDLWNSSLVGWRGPRSLVFHDEVVGLLRERLAARPERLEHAWKLTRDVHAGMGALVRLEEEINWYSTWERESADSLACLEEALGRATRSLLVDGRDSVAGWLVAAHRRLPERLWSNEAARRLKAVAFLVKRRESLGVVEGEQLPEWGPSAVRKVGRSALLGCRLVADALEVGTNLDGPDVQWIKIPETRPLVIEVRWPEGGQFRRELVPLAPGGGPQRVLVSGRQVDVVALSGELWTLKRLPEADEAGQEDEAPLRTEDPVHREASTWPGSGANVFGQSQRISIDTSTVTRSEQQLYADAFPRPSVQVAGLGGFSEVALALQPISSQSGAQARC